MKKSLDHLSAYKQEEIKYIVNQVKKVCKVEFIILYGSYARGDYVEHDVTYVDGFDYPEEFKSDLDILIVLDNPKAIQRNYTPLYKLQSKLTREFIDHKIKSPVSLIFDDVININERLAESNPFFKDVMQQGIELYNSSKHKFNKAHKLTPAEKRKLAQQYFDDWYKKAIMPLDGFELYFEKGKLDNDYFNEAAFNLHQAAERSLHGLLLVFTFYSPKSHDVERLLKDTKKFDPKLAEVFPRETDEEKHLFELLRDSYIKARYSPTFQITRQELKLISKNVKQLLNLMEKICKERIKSYG